MEHPQSHAKTIILTAPQGWGKTRHAQQWMSRYGCNSVVDEWFPGQAMKAGALHLTSAHPNELAHVHCKVVSHGWT